MRPGKVGTRSGQLRLPKWQCQRFPCHFSLCPDPCSLLFQGAISRSLFEVLWQHFEPCGEKPWFHWNVTDVKGERAEWTNSPSPPGRRQKPGAETGSSFLQSQKKCTCDSKTPSCWSPGLWAFQYNKTLLCNTKTLLLLKCITLSLMTKKLPWQTTRNGIFKTLPFLQA